MKQIKFLGGKIIDGIKQGLKEVKEGKTTTYKSVKELMKDLSKERDQWVENHPVLYKIEQAYYSLVRFFEHNVKDLPKRIKWFVQRGKRGYADYDIWSFDYHLAGILSEGLKQLKKEKHGVPNDFCKYKNDKGLHKAARDWDKVLDKMIYTFETSKKILDDNYFYIPTWQWNIKDYNSLKRMSERMRKDYPEDKYKVLTKKESRKFEEGFDLFKKYFFSLWD